LNPLIHIDEITMAHASAPLASPVIAHAAGRYRRAVRALEGLQPLAQLAARGFVAQAFFLSGLTKLRDWPTTLLLFENEYAVPLLPPHVAAWAGTVGEVGLPVLLVLGLAGRFAAAGLSVVNVVAVLSLAEIAPAALQQHQFWGSVLLALVLWGPGRWSLDARLAPRWPAAR
jgi:putative oxidoreductase